MDQERLPVPTKLEFNSYKIMDDLYIYIRQPHKMQKEYYIVIMEDAYASFSAQVMDSHQILDKWGIEL